MNRNSKLKNKYGTTIEEYNCKLIEQEGKCSICSKTAKENGRALAQDHCHATGKLRDLLCDNCNRSIGLLGDDPEILIKAAKYLRRHKDD